MSDAGPDELRAEIQRAHALREEAERRCAESEARYRLLAEHTTDMISRHSPSGVYLYASPACRTLLGLEPSELVGRSAYDFIHPDDVAAITRQHTHLLTAGTPVVSTYRVMTKRGDFLWFETTVKVVSEPGSSTVSELVCVSRDVTKRIEAECLAHALRDDLTHVARLSTIGELASGLAHELMQPLSAIVAFADGLRHRLNHAGVRSVDIDLALSEITAQSLRAGDIIRRMRSFIRKRSAQPQQVRVNELIGDVLTLLNPDLRGSAIELRFDGEATVPPALGDVIQVQQVVLNLARNAIEAMQAPDCTRRRLDIRTFVNREGEIQVSICDYGSGIAEQNFQLLFTPFFSTKSFGLGLGLSISKTIIEAHNGRLWAARNPDRGMTFHFTLPRGDQS